MEEGKKTPTDNVVEKNGAIDSTISLGQLNWLKDSNTYNLGTQKGAGNTAAISIGFIKHSDKTVEVTVSGPFSKTFNFRQPVPANDGQNLPFSIKWGDSEISLYLCEKLVETKKA